MHKAMTPVCGILIAIAMMGAGLAPRAMAQDASRIEARLKQLSIALPTPGQPAGNFVSAVRSGNLLFLAGSTAGNDWPIRGKLGKDVSVDQGYQTARQIAVIQLANIKAAIGNLDRVKRIVKVLGMVNSADGFGDQPRVMNGFSDLMVEVFGEAIGKHARSAVGMAGLPTNQPVEVELIVEVE